MEPLDSAVNPDWAREWIMLEASGLVFRLMTSAAYATEAIAIHPHAVYPKWSSKLLSFAFMESLCIYGLVIALAILFANTLTCL